MPMPPRPAPNQASADASDGTDRTPPTSAAIGFSATTAIHIAPNETPRITSDIAAVIQEVRVSMLGVTRWPRRSFPLPVKQGEGGEQRSCATGDGLQLLRTGPSPASLRSAPSPR